MGVDVRAQPRLIVAPGSSRAVGVDCGARCSPSRHAWPMDGFCLFGWCGAFADSRRVQTPRVRLRDHLKKRKKTAQISPARGVYVVGTKATSRRATRPSQCACALRAAGSQQKMPPALVKPRAAGPSNSSTLT
eukprot:5711619-Prymnesium_polylepis.1